MLIPVSSSVNFIMWLIIIAIGQSRVNFLQKAVGGLNTPMSSHSKLPDVFRLKLGFDRVDERRRAVAQALSTGIFPIPQQILAKQ